MNNEVIYSEEAERAVLSVLLMDGAMANTIDLQPGEFFIKRYGYIYHIIRRMVTAKQTVDFVTLCQAIENDGRMGFVGGTATISGFLMGAYASYVALPEYAAIIRDKANRRAAINLCSEIAKAAGDETKPYNAGRFATELLRSENHPTDTLHISQTLSNFLDWQMGRVDMRERGELDLLPITTIPEIDAMLVYLEEGQETIIAGEPGVGKTMLVQQIVEVNHNVKSLIFSMEMKATRLTARMVSSRSGVPVTAMRMGLPNNKELLQQKINQAVADLEVAGIYINDRPGITVEGMYSEAARMIASDLNIGICAIDYFSMIAEDSQHDNATDKEGIVSGKLQRMFRELNMHGLVIDTYNKTGFNSSHGSMGNITGAARKSFDADNVITLTLGDFVPQSGQMVHADVVKVRDGEVSKRRVSLMREIGKPHYRSLTDNEKANLPR